MSVLITTLGKSRKKTQDSPTHEYQTSDYAFQDGGSVKASFFGDALARHDVFSHVIVIGTYSSTWDALVPAESELSEDEEKLFFQLGDLSGDGKDFPKDLENGLKAYLKKRWHGADVVLVRHSPDFKDARKIIDSYFEAFSQIPLVEEVVLDFTHGMKWMGMLVESVLKFLRHTNAEDTLSMEYGDVQNGQARQLDMQQYREIDRLRLHVDDFFNRFDASALADDLENASCKSIGKSLRKLGSHLAGNFLIPLVVPDYNGRRNTPVDELLKAISTCRTPQEEMPGWLKTLLGELNGFCAIFQNEETASGKLFRLAQLYADRKFYAQALLCQESCLALYAWEKYGGEKGMLNYDDLKKRQKDFINGPEVTKDQREKLLQICYSRNAVAHGACGQKDEKNTFDSTGELPTTFMQQQGVLKAVMGRK